MSIILFILAAFGMWGATYRVAVFIEQDLLGEGQRQTLQAKFENWWRSILAKKPGDFVVELLQQAGRLCSIYFGARLFSKRAFMRSSWISLSLLMGVIALGSVTGAGIQPWTTYDGFIKGLKIRIQKDKAELTSKTGLEAEAKKRAMDVLSKTVEECDKIGWEMLYCAVFYIGLIGGTAVAFFITTAISRMALAEIAASGRASTAIFLLILNLYLSASTIGAFMLWTETLASPLMWCGLLMTVLLAQASLYWVVASIFNGGLAAWIFGHAVLRMAAIIVILPCLGTIMCCLFAVMALRTRLGFHKVCCWLLSKWATDRSLSVMVGSIGLIVVVIATISRLLFALR